MTQLEVIAIRDAEADFGELERSGVAWRLWCDRVRRGDCAPPAMDAIACIGREALCRAWNVDAREWETDSGRWVRLYTVTYCSAIDVMVEHREGRS